MQDLSKVNVYRVTYTTQDTIKHEMMLSISKDILEYYTLADALRIYIRDNVSNYKTLNTATQIKIR